jgi:hypothetical protein
LELNLLKPNTQAYKSQKGHKKDIFLIYNISQIRKGLEMLNLNQKHRFFNICSNIVLLVFMILFSTVQGNAVEINTSIQTGSDDVEERASGRISSSSGDLEMVYDSGDQTIGLRFVNLDIPQGAKITSAYLQFTVDETDSGTTNLNIYGELSNNASAFSRARRDVTSRTKTSTSVAWSVPTWEKTKISTPAQRTPDLKNLVQEIVDLTNWTNNNNMVFIINGTGKRVADSYEGGKKRAPKLYINYELKDNNSNGNDDNNSDNDDEIIDNGDTPLTVGLVDVSVNQKDDDAEESTQGSVSTRSSDLELVYDGSNQTVGMRFRAVNVPKGATITNAYLQFTVDERDSKATDLNIYAEKSATPAIYKKLKYNISSREKTASSVAWSVPAWKKKLESAEKQTTPNLKALVQEVIELNTWSANSDMAFMITGTGKRVADSYEGGANRATKLHIEFTVGGDDDNSTNDNGGDNNDTDGGTDNNTTDGGGDNNGNSGDDNNNTDNGNNNNNNGGNDNNFTGSITFTEDETLNQDNPDRGLFYGEYALNEDAGYDVFQGVKNKGYRLAYVVIDLNDYRGSMTLPQSLFDNLEKNFIDAETAGVKMILRFKYRVDRSSSLVDPSIEMIEAHMNQLKPFLAQHQDIISVIQAGTIGAWGEWNNFTGDFKDTNADYKNNRKRVVDKLAELFPKKYIQLRTPMHKELIYGASQNYSDISGVAKITEEMDFDTNILARLGHHNDCIFANDNDYGTYGRNDIAFWKQYVANDTKYAPVGGVSCGEMEEQYKTCESALSTFKGLGYSFIMDNKSSHRVKLHNQWKTEGCYAEIVNNLGYRLVAKGLDATFDEVHNTLDINFSIANSGFSAPHVPVEVSYVLKSTNNSYSFALPTVDIRKFASKSTNLLGSSLDLSAVASDEYCLYIQLGKNFSAIRLSNSQNSEGVDVWNSSEKLNKLTCGIAVSNDNNNTTDGGTDDNNTDNGNNNNGGNTTTSKKLGMLVPLYVYPDLHRSNSEWQRVIDNKKAHPEAEIIVIANPSSGHFSSADALYVNAIQKTVEANITVVGYVYTQYGARDINVVKADIDNWTRFYKDLGVTGIFFDETEGREAKGQRPYYKALTEYIKSQGYQTSILNPGITADQTFVDNYTADIIVSFESSYTAYLRDFKTGDVGKTIESARTSTALMIHDIDTLAHLQQAIADAPADGFDYVYITTGGNGWNNLGRDFEEQITEMLKYDRDPIPDNGTDDNTSDGGGDDTNTDGGTDNNTTDGGGDDTNTGGGTDNNTTDGGGYDNQTLISKTLTVSVKSGNDDVEQAQTGAMYMNSSDLELVHEGTDQTIGLRFTNLSIPKGATITSAYIQFNTDETGHNDATVLNIYAQNSDNAPTFTSTAYNVSSRAKTTASTVWDVPLWNVLNEQGTAQQTPELKELVQEVVNRSGWTESSALAFIIQGTGKRTADSYEGGASKAPSLHIEYEFLKDVVVVDPKSTSFIEDASANILNPDRGLYTADFDLAETTDYNIFSDPQADGYRMVYAPINLYDYTNTSTLPTSVLETIDTHLSQAESKGVKLILRFKYREDSSSSYLDPALSTILGHMEQLRDILQNHKKIISVIQAGTIGAWGEWNRFTGEFEESDINYKSNRRAVIEKLVDIFPNKFIQIRTPMHKELLYGTSAEYKDEGIEGKITPNIAYTNDIRAKIGHHNDCLLADDTNYGTYGSNIEFWKDYVSNDSKYTPVGGETCWIETGFEKLSDCEYSLAELKRLQYSYLNDVYQIKILNKWKEQGCYQEIKENLGYRLVATHLDTIKSVDNTTLAVSLSLENKGFSAPYIKSTVNLILKNADNSYTFNQADIDMRKFYASETSDISDNLSLEDVESGEYCLYLQMGENFSAIRLSNSRNSDGVDIWNESLKINTLKCGIKLFTMNQ